METAVALPSNTLVSLFVAAVLFAISRPIIRRVSIAESNPWLVRILTISLLLHLLAAPAQIYVVDHLYHGIADWLRYDHQGSILGPEFRQFNFSFANAGVRGIVNDGSVSIATGIVMAIVGVNQLATFLVFSWLSFLGTVMFYRAFTLTFPGAVAGHRRYAIMLFFMPSVIFWTADVSKEAIMMLSLGITSYGASKVLARRPGGFTLLAVGVAVGILIRPNDLLILLGGFAVALMVRPSGGRESLGGAKRIAGLAFMGSLLFLSVFLTLHYLHTSGGSLSLNQVSRGNSGIGAGLGSSNIPYSSSPFAYWRDIYTVLLDPLPINAHGMSQMAAALENLLIVVLVLISLRELRMTVRASFARPYVMMCAVYSILFVYAFAALGNLGLITRERALLFPLFLVPLCIPRTPRGRPPAFDWELKRRARNRRRRAMGRSDASHMPVGIRRSLPITTSGRGDTSQGHEV
jgi:hypothetical protein